MSNLKSTPSRSSSISAIRPLIDFMDSIVTIPMEMKILLAQGCNRQLIAKNRFILDAYERHDRFLFIVSGTLRGVIGRRPSEITTWIATEPGVIFSLKDNDQQNDLGEYIQTVEKTEVIYIARETVDLLFVRYQQMGIIARKVILDFCQLTLERAMMIRLAGAEQRYERVIMTHPEYFRRIPLRILSSYMGMRMETLSRLRSKAAVC